MKRLCFLPSAIRVMTWQELALHVNDKQFLDSAVLLVSPSEQGMFIPKTEWNRVAALSQIKVRPDSDGCNYPSQGVPKAIADFVVDLAGSEEYASVSSLVVTVYDGEKERFNKQQYACAIAAAIADWATGSNAMEYYAAVQDHAHRPDKLVYNLVSAELSKHKPEFSEPGE